MAKLEEVKEFVIKELKRIPGVEAVEVFETIKVHTIINDYSNESLREEVYDMERKILEQFPELSIDFTATER